MAVFTNINKKELEEYLQSYSLGNLISYEGIIEGIENTNYKIITDKGCYILTIFEKRVDPEDIPFFIDLHNHLSENNFACPIPIKNKDDNVIDFLKSKKAIIISFLEGEKINSPNPSICEEVGTMVAKLHTITKSFNKSRKNSLGLKKWREIYNSFSNIKEHKFLNIIKSIDDELYFLEKNWPNNLPSGIIHGDLFKDNIFFQNNNLSGVIDFYFSCKDFYAYELAITINAWCFDEKGNFIKENFNSLYKGYQKVSSLNDNEKKIFNTLLRGAAVRILVTRLHDFIYHPNEAIVIPKDPLQFFNILKWHQNNLVSIV